MRWVPCSHSGSCTLPTPLTLRCGQSASRAERPESRLPAISRRAALSESRRSEYCGKSADAIHDQLSAFQWMARGAWRECRRSCRMDASRQSGARPYAPADAGGLYSRQLSDAVMPETVYVVLLLIVLCGLIVLIVQFAAQARMQGGLPAPIADSLEQKHRAMLVDLHEGLAQQSERAGVSLHASSEGLRAAVGDEWTQTREAVHALRLAVAQNLAESREAMLGRLADSTQALAGRIDERLEQISGRVSERLEDGFKKTNETFVNVMTRLATIDEAQRKIDGLTSNVVSLQELLGDKRARGAFGEVQLEALVRNVLPRHSYHLQHVLPNGSRVDCLLELPEPTGSVCID